MEYLSKQMRISKAAALLALILSFTAACSRGSEEARIREFLEKTAAKAEKRDIESVTSRLAGDYRDFEGRDKPATQALLRQYFKRSGIVIHLLGVEIETDTGRGRASVKAEVMLSSGAAEIFRRLVRYAGECFRFSLDLKKDPAGDWLVESAGWESVSWSDLFPESAAILEKLFPDG
jgi:hypothetical protein